MNKEKSINKKKYDNKGNVWKYKSVGRIASAIASEYDTVTLLRKIGIKQGTLNKFLRWMVEEGIIRKINQNTLNKRNKEEFIYDIDYLRLIDRLFGVLQEEGLKQRELIENARLEINKRKEKLMKKRKTEEKILKKINKNKEETKLIKKKLDDINFSIDVGLPCTERHLKKMIFLINDINTLSIKNLSIEEKVDVEETLRSLFYLHLITNNQKRSLHDILTIFLDSIKRGYTEYYPHYVSIKSNFQGITTKGNSEINEKRTPTLHKIREFWIKKDSPEVLF